MCKEGWCVGLGQRAVAWGWGDCLKYLKMCGTEKRGGERDLKRRVVPKPFAATLGPDKRAVR